jgi:hypothetical protein
VVATEYAVLVIGFKTPGMLVSLRAVPGVLTTNNQFKQPVTSSSNQ